MGDAPRCTARTHAGRPCRNSGLRKPDGTHTKTCRFHSGEHELRERGDPKRGGRPIEHGFYSEVLRPELKPIYARAMEELGKLDHELALARTNLYEFQRQAGEQAKGGIPSSVSGGGQSVSIRSYADIVGEYLDRISRMEFRRARILEAVGGSESNDSDLLGHEEWLKAARSRKSRRPGSS